MFLVIVSFLGKFYCSENNPKTIAMPQVGAGSANNITPAMLVDYLNKNAKNFIIDRFSNVTYDENVLSFSVNSFIENYCANNPGINKSNCDFNMFESVFKDWAQSARGCKYGHIPFDVFLKHYSSSIDGSVSDKSVIATLQLLIRANDEILRIERDKQRRARDEQKK